VDIPVSRQPFYLGLLLSRLFQYGIKSHEGASAPSKFHHEVYVKTSAAFRAGAEFLREHEWTQGSYARDADNIPVYPWDPTATCFCALGAIQAATKEQNLNMADNCASASYWLSERFSDLDERTISSYNDMAATSKERVIDRMLLIADRLEARNR
jgi:hypothetical protein